MDLVDILAGAPAPGATGCLGRAQAEHLAAYLTQAGVTWSLLQPASIEPAVTAPQSETTAP
jgi:hypothetical protein